MLVAAVVMVALAAPGARQIIQSAPVPVASMEVSRDGIVATIGTDDSVRLWQLDTRTMVRLIPATALGSLVHPIEAAWDEATHELVLARGNGLLAIDLDGNLRERPGDGERLRMLDGKRWAAATYGKWQVRDATGAVLGTLAEPDGDVAFAADGASLATLTKDGIVTYTLAPFGRAHAIKLGARPYSISEAKRTIALSRNGKLGLACIDSGVARVDVVHQTATTLVKDSPGGCAVAIDDASDTAVAVLGDDVLAFSVATGAARWHARLPSAAANMATGPNIAVHDGKVLATVDDGRVELYDVAHGDAIAELGSPLFVPATVAFAGEALVAVGPSGRSIFDASRELTVWSLRDGTQLSRGVVDWGSKFLLREDGQLAVARRVVSGADACWVFSVGTTSDAAPAGAVERDHWPPRPGHSASLCIPVKRSVDAIDLAHGVIVAERRVFSFEHAPVALEGADGGIAGLVMELSPDGNWVVGYNLLGALARLRIWDRRVGKRAELVGDPKRGAGFTAYAFEGDRIAVASDDVVTVYQLPSRRVVRTIDVKGKGTITAVAFLGGELVVGTTDGHVVTTRGATLIAGDSDGGSIRTLVVRGDGRRVATISDDGGVRIWQPATGEMAATFVQFADGEHLATTPEGAYAGRAEAASRVAWVFDHPVEGFSFERFAAVFAKPELVGKRLAGSQKDVAAALVRPPRVTVAPPPGAATGGSIDLGAHVEGPRIVREVRAFVEGRPESVAKVGERSGDVKVHLELHAGTNVITLIAFDEEGRASNPAAMTVQAPQAKGARPDLWVVAAGVGWYPNLAADKQLAAPVADARSIADALVAETGPGGRYATPHVTVLEDEQVTPQSLEAALAGLSAMKPDDVAVVFLAGHGVKPPGSDRMVFLTSTAHMDPKTWAADGVDWSVIARALKSARGRVLVFLDACHSGHVTQDLVVPNTTLADELVVSQRTGAIVFAASKGDQASLEANAERGLVLDDAQQSLVGPPKHPKRAPKAVAQATPPLAPPMPTTPTAPRPRGGHGYFTGAVLAALAAPSTDTNHDGVIEVSELLAQVSMRVIAASHGRQTPWVARRELFGDFAFASAAK